MKIARFAVAGAVLLALTLPMAVAAEAEHSTRNYLIVFHTKLSGQSEDMGMTITEGDFSIKVGEPEIGISGYLDVTEDFMYRLDYQFSHVIRGDEGAESGRSRYYERSGSVILEPGQTIEVIQAPNVELRIELQTID